MISRGDMIRVAVLIALFVAIYFRYGSGQTTVAPEQIGATYTLIEWAKCTGSGTGKNPDGSSYVWDCNGLEFMRLRRSDGSTRSLHVLESEPGFYPDGKWVSQPLK